MEFIVHAAIAIGFFIYAFVIFDKIYSSKKFRLLPKILFIAGASLVIALADTFRIPLLNSLMSFVSLLIMNNLFYKPEGKAYIIYDAMLTIISVIVEMLAVLLLAFSIGVSTEIMLDTPNLLAASAILYSIVMIAVAKSFLLLVSGKGMNNIRTHEFIMFLVLTGYLMTSSLLRRLQDGPAALLRFWFDRFLRIWPPMAAMVRFRSM